MTILGVYTSLKGVRGNLDIELSVNKEKPEDIRGVSVQWIVSASNICYIKRKGRQFLMSTFPFIYVYTPLPVFKCAVP